MKALIAILLISALTQAFADASLDTNYCPSPDKRTTRCTREYKPVIGYDKSKNGKVYGNACVACSNPEVEYYMLLHNCDFAATARCGFFINPVCGYNNNAGRFETFLNECIGCSTNSIRAQYFFRAECPGKPVTYCDTRTEICPQIYSPVCGMRNDGTTKTYSSDCNACSDGQVIFHTPGECF